MYVGFDQPWFLLLLAILPGIWVISFNSLAGLGRWRRLFAIGFRTLVFTVLVCCLANIQWKDSTDSLTVIYLLDQSDSIPADKRDFMLNYVHREVREHRRDQARDRAGVIIFGGNAKIESAPYDGDLPLIDKLEAGFDLNRDTTSLEAAFRLAKASFPEDSARRIVVISDGNENIGDALSMAQAMADEGIGIDVVPIDIEQTAEVSVDKVVLPADLRQGQDFEVRVVLTNDTVPSDANPTGEVTGRLKLIQRVGNDATPVAEAIVTLQPGKNVRGFNHSIDRSSIYTYEASFVPLDETQDMIKKNNVASTFTRVRGKGRVLLIEDASYPGEFQHLIEKLQENSIDVDLINTTELFTSAAELLHYDSIILANVARATGDTVENTASFSDDQIRMLVQNCEELGAGLLMLGGPRSLGAGGWANTELERAMPVDFQIKNDKVNAVGALVMMMHASEIAQSNHWQTQIAREAIKILGPMDYCGVVTWNDQNGRPRWLWTRPTGVDRVFDKRRMMMGMVGRMSVGDMPDFNEPMKLALNGFKTCGGPSGPPSIKHMIIISDGDPTPPTQVLLNQFVNDQIVISTVACGTHMQSNNPLRRIARVTGGKYYAVRDARALPKIFQREARRVAKPVIKESKVGLALRTTDQTGAHEMMLGVNLNELPPFYGYVLTTVKKNPLVEQLLLASDPDDDGENSTILATWRYGLGRATVLSTDAGHTWTTDWLNNAQFEKMFVQMVRYSMRPITEDANFTIATEVKDGRAQVVMTALDEDEEFLNFLEISGRGVAPDMKGFDLAFKQTAPGRYVAEHDITQSGNFLFSIFPGEGYERLTAGVSVPYSTEYSDRKSNQALLDNLSQFRPKGGQSGELITGELNPDGLDNLMKYNTFRPTLSHAISIQDLWPLMLVVGSLIFFADVFVRRVAIDWTPLWALLAALRSRFGRDPGEQRSTNIARLQSRKAEIEKTIESRRAATRFVAEADESKMSGRDRLDQVIGSEIDKTPAAPPPLPRDRLDAESEQSFTSRLLDAKRKALKKRPEDQRDLEE